ncbi:MAG: RdgB/HAM1 family non-canonical purine NTP pyrophosphatase [Alphaproteobacteria bacterium]|nr:RdgB/HAM1 family non-canonical purine NTP pyrophosphatase [Alphaproteobacteria bacterium]
MGNGTIGLTMSRGMFVYKGEIVLCSGNSGKIAEIKEYLGCSKEVAVVSKKAEIDIDETGQTFKENALIKAKAVYEQIHKPVLADDSGVCVDALNGEPGIYSARYAGENKTDADRCLFLLNKMKNITDLFKRSCHMTTCLCYIDQAGREHFFEKSLKGQIAFAPHGQNGHGYDPIFLLPNGKCLAELTIEEKNKVSPRGQAIRAFVDEIF